MDGRADVLNRIEDDGGATRVSCVPQAESMAGSYAVQLSLNGVQWSITDAVLDYVPRISLITPSAGPVSGGTVISLRGSGFSADTEAIECVFGGASANHVRTTVSHKALPFCCASTAFPSKTVPFCAVPQQQAFLEDGQTVRCSTPWNMEAAGRLEVSLTADTSHHGEYVHGVSFTVYDDPQVSAVNPTVLAIGAGTTVAATVLSDSRQLWIGIFPGSSATGLDSRDPAISCSDILAYNRETPSGTYWLQPTAEVPAFQVFCDMLTDGGGWEVLAVTTADGDAAGIVVGQASYADTWTKADDDAAQYFDWVVENDLGIALNVGAAGTLVKELVYVHPQTRRQYTSAQLAALRQTCTELSFETRMVATATGDNTVTIFSGERSLLLTPHASVSDSLTAFYIWDDRQYDTTVAGGAPKHILRQMGSLDGFVIPDRVEMAISDGGAAFGWMQSSFRVRKPMVPSMRIPPGDITGSGSTRQFTTPDISDQIDLFGDVYVECSIDGQMFTSDRMPIITYLASAPPVLDAGGIFPPTGRKTGGTTVVIHGSNFADIGGQLTCEFDAGRGANRVAATLLASDKISCDVPANRAGAVSYGGTAAVRVSNNGQLWSVGTAGQSGEALEYRYTSTAIARTYVEPADENFNVSLIEAGSIKPFQINAINEYYADGRANYEPATTGGDIFDIDIVQVCTEVAGSRCYESDTGERLPYLSAGAVMIDMDSRFQTIAPLLFDTGDASTLTTAEVGAELEAFSPTRGTFVGMFKSTVSGLYRMSITSGGGGIKHNPFDVMISPAQMEVERSGVHGLFGHTTVGLTNTIRLQTVDTYGNNRTGDWATVDFVVQVSCKAPPFCCAFH
eukprot:SAG22_NODE_1139_length_5389_cov_1.755577_3_plen_850_part_00